MTKYILAYVVILIVFLGCDTVWLGLAGQALYQATLGDILLPQFNLAPALIFYLLYIAGLVIFAVKPAYASGTWQPASVYGALFGFFAYATYDLTNMATLRNWTLQITLADLAWGTILSAVSASAGVLISRFLLRKLKTQV